MQSQLGRITILILLLSSFTFKGFSQTEAIATKDTATDILPFAVDYQFEFPNVNRVKFYYDKKKRKKINKADKKNDWQLELKLLRNYVQHFGIENFQVQTGMIWKLGQLEEQAGNLEEAKSLYRLAIHNHHKNVKHVKKYYDSLIALDVVEYVPIEYYFKLTEMRNKVDTLYPPRNVYSNMGESVNSKRGDYGPTMNVEDNELIFTSKRNVNGIGNVNEDIYVTKWDYGSWTGAEPIGLPINSGNNDGSPCLSTDNKYLFFARCNCLRCEGCDIFYVERLGEREWGKVTNLGDQVNSPYWDSHPSLSRTGDTLYFASDRIGGFGGSDIWYSTKNADGTWATAKNMGPVVNTKDNEVSPFYHPKYHVLYFSSDAVGRHVNFGDFDIYRSHYMHGKFREPKNVGPLVNGKGSEFYFTIDSQSKKIYYANQKKGDKSKQNLDLFSYPLPMGANPLATTRLEGTVSDEEENPFKGVVSIIDLDNAIEIAPTNLKADGSYEFDLVDSNNYLMVIHGEDFFRIEKQFRLEGDTKMDLNMHRVSVKKFVFENLEFGNGSAEILPAMHEDLKKLLDFLIDNPFYHLIISGHTDSHGDAETNKQLSKDRALSIKEWLIDQSFMAIEPERIQSYGYGSEMPLVEEKTDHDRTLNRRVDFEIISGDDVEEDDSDWENAPPAD